MKEKARLRAALKEKRAALAPAERFRQEKAIQQHLVHMLGSGRARYFPNLPKRPVCSLYYPVGDEISLLEVARSPVLSSPVIWSLPVVTGRSQPLAFRRWAPGEPLDRGAFDIPVPVSEAPAVTPDILLVPLLGVDARGHRIGYGGGFYDRTLAALRTSADAKEAVRAVGVAFDCQKVPCLPQETTDEPLDFIVTAAGIERFSS